MITTNSPRGGFDRSLSRCVAAGARTISSNRLVSSRATTMSASPKTSPIASRAATIRCGDSYTTIVVSSSRSAFGRFRRLPGFTGRNPSKTKRSAGTPAAESAAATADGPGTGTTSMPAARASRTSRKPGSEMPGVPASVTRATEAPSASAFKICGPRASLLCSKYETVGVWMSKCESSARVRRVSSQAISATSRSTRSARADTSSRLPMGVATTKRVPRSLRLRGLFLGLGHQHRTLVVQDHLARDDALLEALDGRQLVHDLEHDLFEYGAQAARAGAPLERLARDGGHRVVGELEADLLEIEVLLILLDDRVLRLLEDADQRRVVEVVQRGDDGEPADEFRDEAVAQQVLRLDHREQITHAPLRMALDLCAEAHARAPHPALDVLVEADERAAADEQDVGGIDLNELLMRMLSTALRRDIGDRALEDFQQGLLHAFARHVARDRGILRLARYFIDLVDVHDSSFGSLHVIVRSL